MTLTAGMRKTPIGPLTTAIGLYASSNPQDYGYYRPGYRYGYEAAGRYKGRRWEDVESDLSRSWNAYEHRGTSTWEQMKEAVRDAWDRVTGKHTVSR